MSTQNRTYPSTDTQDKRDRRHDEPGIGTEDRRPRRNIPGSDSPIRPEDLPDQKLADPNTQSGRSEKHQTIDRSDKGGDRERRQQRSGTQKQGQQQKKEQAVATEVTP